MEFPKVSILILNWNGLEGTTECLKSLKKITYPNYEIIVVDNGSNGDDADVLEANFKDYIKLIRNDKNYGCSEGRNIAIRLLQNSSKPDYYLFMNNDMTVDPEFLTELVKVSERQPDIGIVGPKIYYFDFPDVIMSAGAKIDLNKGLTPNIGYRQQDKGQFDLEREVDFVSGCCMLIKNSVINKIGLVDNIYFCYFEDTDFCIRANRAGFKIIYCPLSKAWDKNRLVKKWWGGTEEKVSCNNYYFMARNSFIFVRKHGEKKQYQNFVLYQLLFGVWYSSAVCIFHHLNIKQALALFRGTYHGLRYPQRLNVV
jgi:GT2 family glycosyltransferase